MTGGEVIYGGKDLLAMSPEARARRIFWRFNILQIPGISYFLKAAVNAVRKHRGLEELDAMEFLRLSRKNKIGGDGGESHQPAAQRRFFRGEKKRNEILQMACWTRN